MNLTTFALSSAALLIQQYADFYKQTDLEKTLEELEPDYGLPRILEYDYIVVGGGTAGCLLAARLSEKYQVLLLEKGGDPPPMTYPNIFYSTYESDLNINDAYKLMPQENYALEKPGDKFNQVGRMLGGSGSHNSNIYNRGSPHDYDCWANLTGDVSWSYKNVLQHYKRMEDFVGWLINEGERYEYYGHGGPLKVTTYLPPHLQAWFEAGKELGFPISDPNAHQIPSFSTIQTTFKNGVRESSYTAFLKRAEGRWTLKVLRYSEVDRILVDNGNAYGVAFKRHGIPQIAHAKREVILSAGVFASPIILMKSGIGPKSVLEEAGIPLISDVSGVGKNLLDHPIVNVNFRSESGSPLTDIDFQIELQKFHSPQRHGFLAKLKAAQAFVASTRANREDGGGWADLYILTFLDEIDSSSYTLVLGLGRPKSFGEMFFNATAYKNGERDTVQLGRPDFKYFSAEGDLDALVDGIKLGVKAYEETVSFKRLNLTITETTPSACEGLVPKSDEYWKCFTKQRTSTCNHMGGTCKMGNLDEDSLAVVDSKLRVRGVGKLRIVDASVMPKIPNSNTNAIVLVIAEKTAAEILYQASKIL